MAFKYRTMLVTLATPDLKQLVDFYSQLLNQPPVSFIPNSYAEFQGTGFRLGLFKPKVGQEAEFLNTGKSSLSLCFEVVNLEAAIAHLTTLGYPPSGSVLTTPHGREIYAYDPLGNRLILYQPKTSSGS